jgi:hypothetical protein
MNIPLGGGATFEETPPRLRRPGRVQSAGKFRLKLLNLKGKSPEKVLEKYL